MTWNTAPPGGRIGENDTHVWLIELPAIAVDAAEIGSVLAPEELSRGAKFFREIDRRRYLTTRFALRDILGRYGRELPERIEFDYNAFGKPSLIGEAALRFNVSHAGEVSLVAVAWNRQVGVDVEKIRGDSSDELVTLRNIARRFFAPNEVNRLLQLPEAALPQSFFTCWTRKEAFIKAKGAGLSIPLDSFEVSFLPGERPELMVYSAGPEENERWSVFHLEPAPGYVGALVVEGEDLRLKQWNWKP